jgi:hypothetical protein
VDRQPTPVSLLVELLSEVKIADYPSALAAELACELVREFRQCARDADPRRPNPANRKDHPRAPTRATA